MNTPAPVSKTLPLNTASTQRSQTPERRPLHHSKLIARMMSRRILRALILLQLMFAGLPAVATGTIDTNYHHVDVHPKVGLPSDPSSELPKQVGPSFAGSGSWINVQPYRGTPTGAAPITPATNLQSFVSLPTDGSANLASQGKPTAPSSESGSNHTIPTLALPKWSGPVIFWLLFISANTLISYSPRQR